MRVLKRLMLMALLAAASTAAWSQAIDVGRGELPVTVPDDYSGERPAPLIVLLHGYTSNGPRVDGYMGLSDVADEYGFLLVAPEGMREPQDDENPYWNASDACCNFYDTGVDDVGYLMSVIERMQEEYSIDDRRIYLIGHSNGGFMSYRMAYEHSDTIAAMISLAGASHAERRDPPEQPVNVLQIHGTADGTIAYQGGEIRETRYPGAMQTVRQWAGYNGCTDRGRARERRDLDASLPGHETGVLSFAAGCQPGGAVELWTITAGAHSPTVSDSYAAQLVEWLYEHPKPPAR
ncbi:MAG: PHB depolymerase family esterase [Pseudohongiellaceae bacterium]